MPITLRCECGKVYHVKDELAGRTGRCKVCNKTFTIPAAEPPPLPVARVAHPKPVTAQPAKLEPAANPPGLWGFLGKVKETAKKAHEHVQTAKENIQKVREAVGIRLPPTLTASDTGLRVLERSGMGGLFAKQILICLTCKTKLKLPPPEWGRFGICPGCQQKIRVPLTVALRDELIRELAGLLHLDVASSTVQHALGHAVDAIYPTAQGGTVSFLQMKVLADQIRHNSVKDALGDVEEGRVDKLLKTAESGFKANPDDPLVAAAGTPIKLVLWLIEQFGGSNGNLHLEGSVGHPNGEVNDAYFILQNNLSYEDDPYTKFSTTMLENLLLMAREHQQNRIREAEIQVQKTLLQQQLNTQQAMQDAAHKQAAAAGNRCWKCSGKGWLNVGKQDESRCPECGGQGILRY